MKKIAPLFVVFALLMTSCVSKKKFTELTGEKDGLMESVSQMEGSMAEMKSQISELNQSNSELEKEKNAIDKNLSGVMTQLEDQGKDVAALKENLEQKQYQMNQMWTDMESAFSGVENAAAQSDARIKQLESFLYLDFNESFTFNSASDNVLSENNATVDKIADMLMRNPGVTLVVEGHADKRGIVTGKYEDNLHLSMERAASVIRKLVAKGVNPAQLIASGRGDTMPVAEGANSNELRPNRRAEFIVVPNVGKIYKMLSDRK